MKRREFLGASLIAVAASPVRAAVPKPFRASLIGGTPMDDLLIAGIAITMDPGWKTYWRMPGEAGIPPDFDWKRSKNAAHIEVLFPAPHRYIDAAGEGVGYKDNVVFPVRVRPHDPAAPVELNLDMFFAVCRDVCIPAQTHAGLTLGLSTPVPRESEAIAQALGEIPQSGGPEVVTSATLADRDGRPALVLGLAKDAIASVTDVFVETDTAAYFRAPRPDGTGLVLPVDGLKSPAGLRGKVLTLTITRSAGALEQRVTVD